MPDDTLSGVIRTFMSVTRTVTNTDWTDTRTISPAKSYVFVDGGANVLGADQVWSSTRSLTGGTTQTIDLLDLKDYPLDAEATTTFRSIRAVRVANNMTITGPRIVVGPGASQGWTRVQGDVGPSGELLAVNNLNHWPVGDNTKNLQFHATGATGATGLISFTITIVGSTVTGATGY